jgi:PAS domain S-box-containing protein
MNTTLGRRIPQILFIIAIILLIAVAFFTVRSIGSLSEALKWDKHTQQVLLQLDETLIEMVNAETGARGFLITAEEDILQPYNTAQQNVKGHLTRLRELAADNSIQAEKIARLEKLLDERISFLKQAVNMRRTNSLDIVKEQSLNGKRGRELSNEVRLLIDQMKDEENNLYVQRENELNKNLAYTRTLTYLAGFTGIFFLGFAAFANFRETERRRKAEAELRDANKDLEKRVNERTQELQERNEELKENIRQRELSEQYHRIALESGNMGAWRFDPKNNKAEVDERGLSFFGFAADDFDGSGMNIFSRIHEEDYPLIEKEFQSSLAERRNFNVEFRVPTPEGSFKWANCTGQPQLDENGEITYVIGNCRDITDGKESEMALRRSEKQVRNVIDNLFAFVGVLSPEGILLEANKTALNYASLEAEEVIGKEFAETYWWNYSEEVQEKLRDSIVKAAAGESIRYDVTVRVGEDQYVPIDFMIAPLYDDDGRITHLVPSGLDLTPRKEAEDALRKSENFANAILNSLSAHIAVVDKKGEIVAVNEAWKNFAKSNCSAESLVSTGVGQNYLDVCRKAQNSTEEAEIICENLQAILRGEQKSFSLEYPCHSPIVDRWFMMQINAMHGEEGGAAISHINITDRKKAEIELKNSEEFNRSIFESSPDSVMIMKADGKLHSINTSSRRLMEIDDFTHLIGKDWVELWEDEENEVAYQAVQQALRGKIARFEGFRKTMKGTAKWWDVTLSPVFDTNGQPTLLISNSRDITERREFESALHRSKTQMEFILEVAQLGIWSIDIKNNTASRSLRHDQIFGYQKLLPDWTYETFLEHVLPELRTEADEKFQNAIKNKTEWDIETKIRRADGKIRWIWARGQMQEDDDGELKMHGTVTDITERKEAERERERLLENEKVARKDAEIANRMRDEFLATVSHELRAPLNSILGWGRLLEKGNLDEPTTEKAIKTIVRNAESQNRLIEDLLDVSRIISGKLRLEVMTIKPINIVESALETVRPAAEAKGIILEIKEDSDISHISGDPNRLQQVIWNLLSNAIKFTPNDGRVTLEIEREDDYVNLRVKDTGVGIKEEFLPHVFDRFRQADASSIRKFGGLGLGLAIVRHITEMHGGTVHVDSEGEGKGSTFTVRLPLLSLQEEDESQTEVREELLSEKNPNMSLDGLLILVVDDEEDTRQLLVQALTFYGATVISASSAEEALSAIQDKNPEFLVSDIGMPDEDGYSLIKKVRSLPDEHQRNIVAVALTAFTRAQDRMRALAAGFQNHVSKPVEPDELVTVIASLTGRLRMDDED